MGEIQKVNIGVHVKLTEKLARRCHPASPARMRRQKGRLLLLKNQGKSTANWTTQRLYET